MEKFTTQEIKVNGKKVSFYSWRFTEEERKDLRTALLKYPDEKAFPFIDDLETICLHAKHFLNTRNVTFQRTEKRRMVGRFEKAEKELYALIDKHRDPKEDVPLREKKSIFDNSIFSEEAVILEKERLHYLVLAAATQLKEIISIIKDESGEPGRPSGGAVTGELVKVIAHGFKNLLGKPTGYRPSGKQGSGAFFSVVQAVLKACELPFEDPSRHIKAALKSL